MSDESIAALMGGAIRADEELQLTDGQKRQRFARQPLEGDSPVSARWPASRASPGDEANQIL